MAYVIDKFGAVYATATILPTLEGSQPQGAGPVGSSLVRLPGGGAYDWRGSDRARREAEPLRLKGEWVADSTSAMETKLAALQALVGTRSKLWRSNGTTQHWRLARLLELKGDLGPGVAVSAPLELVFEAAPGGWSGTAHDDTTTLDTSPKTITVANGGNLLVTDAVLTLTAGSVAITGVTIAVSGVSAIGWAGTLAAGTALAIDCGARTVRQAGADAYAGFSLEAGHKVTDWLRLEPGNNSVVVTLTGGGADSTLRVEYADGWA